jgi:O-antigen/teichoic acid export membrane protein
MPTPSLRILIYKRIPEPLKPFWHSVESSAIGSRLARGAFWSLVGGVASRGLMLLASILIARILGRDVYGEYGMIRSTSQMFLVFAGFGLGLTATRHVAQYRRIDPQRAGRIISLSGVFAFIIGFIIALFLVVIAPWVAQQTINAPHLADELRIGAVILFLSALNGAQTGALAGFEAFKTIAIVNLKVGILSFPILVAGAYFDGLRGALWALVINMAINWIFNHLALRNESKKNNILFKTKDCIHEWPILWRYSFPAALSGILATPALWICNAMLVNQPGGYAQMGLFDAANQWRIATLFIPATLSGIALPMLSDFDSKQDNMSFLKVLKYNAILIAGTSLLIALPILLFSKPIMRLYGKGFEDGYWTLCLLSLSTILVSLNSIIGQAIASRGKMWVGFWFNFLWACVLLTSCWLFTKCSYGAMGLSISFLISYLFHSIWQSIYLSLSLRRPNHLPLITH